MYCVDYFNLISSKFKFLPLFYSTELPAIPACIWGGHAVCREVQAVADRRVLQRRQQDPGDRGLPLSEAGGQEVVEEALLCPPRLRSLLLPKRKIKSKKKCVLISEGWWGRLLSIWLAMHPCPQKVSKGINGFCL